MISAMHVILVTLISVILYIHVPIVNILLYDTRFLRQFISRTIPWYSHVVH